LVDKSVWNIPEKLAQQIKHLKIELEGFRPIEEAISCAGGVKQAVLTQHLQLKSNPLYFAVVKCWIGMPRQVDIC
jgi:predicted flavoprotein YhiN